MRAEGRTKVLQLLRPSAAAVRSYALPLARHLDRSRFELTLAAPAEVLDLAPPEPLSDVRFEALELHEHAEPLGLVYGSVQLASLIRRGQYDVLHAHGLRAALAASLGGRGAGVLVATLHNPLDAETSLPVRQVLAVALRAFTHCTAPSERVRADLLKLGVPRQRTTVLPFGVTEQKASPEELQAARQAACADRDAVLVVIAGEPRTERQMTAIVQFAACLRQRVPGVRIAALIEGVGLRRRDALRAAGVTPVAVPHPALMQAAALIALPGPGPSLPQCALDAMVSGRPVLAAAEGEVAEVLVDGATGRLCPAGDFAGMAETAAQLLADPEAAARMAERARQAALRGYSSASCVRRLESLYLELLKVSTGGPGLAAV